MAEWTDLTQTLSPASPTLPPLHPKPEYEDYATLDDDGYNSTMLHLETHCGTHMDAPTHFYGPDEHRTIDEVTPDEMVGEGVVFKFREKAPGSAIGRDELVAAAEAHGLRAGDYAIFDCGMAPADTDEYLTDFVYPTEGAAEYLVERDVTALAIDALSADEPGATLDEHDVHRTLLPNGVLIVEGLANLGAVDAGRHDVVCTPIPYEGRDGSQVRFLVRPR